MVHQQNAVFPLQETDSLNASASTRSTYNEPLQVCTRGTKSTQMRVNQVTQATAGPLHSQERQGPGRSRQATPATDQDIPGDGHHPQLFSMAGECEEEHY
jgi:hypothetical protein